MRYCHISPDEKTIWRHFIDRNAHFLCSPLQVFQCLFELLKLSQGFKVAGDGIPQALLRLLRWLSEYGNRTLGPVWLAQRDAGVCWKTARLSSLSILDRKVGGHLEQRVIRFRAVDVSEAIHGLSETRIVALAEDHNLQIGRGSHLRGDTQGVLVADLASGNSAGYALAFRGDSFNHLRAMCSP
jgi:hypothetical protein